MFQILKNPQYDFMKRAYVCLGISSVLVLLAIGALSVHGLNLGIEFTGGTELQIKYKDAADVGAVRSALQEAGIPSPLVTTIGDPSEHEIYIRIGTSGREEDDPDDLTSKVTATLRGAGSGAKTDLNIADSDRLENELLAAPSLDPSAAKALAKEITQHRKEVAIFHDVDDLAGLRGMTPEVLSFLKEKTTVGNLALRSQSYIGPAIGRELMSKAMWAIIGSLVGMLIYIWIRFQLYWGMAAVVALGHDTILTLGLFSLFNQELSLPVVAAFLTLVGYSVNDTVVVFDRIRENLANRSGGDFQNIINVSINQTLSRTVITSGLTWVVVFGLYLFGGAALEPFSFVLTVGVIVGTYSSIFIAAPLLMVGKRLIDKRAGATQAPAAVAPRARKVRTS